MLDEATPDQAISALGKPKSEKKSDRYMAYRNKSLKDAKALRILQWKDTHGFDEVTLYFVDGTLAIIQLEKPKEKLPAKVFVDAYDNVSFDVGRGGSMKPFTNLKQQQNARRSMQASETPPAVLAELYLAISLDPGKVDKLSGNVVIVIIQNRRMDDKRGVDALK